MMESLLAHSDLAMEVGIMQVDRLIFGHFGVPRFW